MTYRISIAIILLFFIFTAEKCSDSLWITPENIEKFVEDSTMVYIDQFEAHVGDTFLMDVFIWCDDLTDYVAYDGVESGIFFYPNEIIINTKPSMFVAYRLADLSGYQKDRYISVSKFVKSTMLHEIMHVYFTQQTLITDDIDRAYRNTIRILTERQSFFTSTFIEEGVCEYLVQSMGEIIPNPTPFIPRTSGELRSKSNHYLVMYEYSAYYLKDFLDKYGYSMGIQILIKNPPPTYDELLNPELFFQRLM